MCKCFLVFYRRTLGTDREKSWRRMRKAANEALHKGAIGNFHESQINAAILLACGGLADPAQWDNQVQHTTATMTLSTVYDHPIDCSKQAKIVEAINGFSQRVAAAAYPGAYLVEFFPWMQYIPSRCVRSSIFGLCLRISELHKALKMEARCHVLA
jgi:hypothetical protein